MDNLPTRPTIESSNAADDQDVGDRRLETARRLVAEARACYARVGVEKTTIADVAQRAGISRRTVYRYFQSPDALLLAVVNEELSAIYSQAWRIWRDRPFLDAVIEVPLLVRREIHQSPPLLHLITGEGSRGPLRAMFDGGGEYMRAAIGLLSPHVQRARAAGDLRADVSEEEVVEWVVHLAWSLVLPNPLTSHDDDGYVRKVFQEFVLPGLRPAEVTLTTTSPGREARRRSAGPT